MTISDFVRPSQALISSLPLASPSTIENVSQEEKRRRGRGHTNMSRVSLNVRNH
jgi:hypothetical protein